MQCKGITTKGIRCKCKTDNDYCKYHISQANTQIAPLVPVKTETESKSYTVNNAMIQCKGLTKKGKPCKKKTTQEYWDYHINQSKQIPSKIPVKNEEIVKTVKVKVDKPKEGFIYIYTLQKFFDKTQLNWFVTKGLPKSKSNEWNNYELGKSKYIFVKIGMTTKSVETRIKQWEDQCKHKIKLLSPKEEINKRSLSAILRKLRSNSDLDTYGDGGFHSKDVANSEKEIHKRLHDLHGTGIIHCKNCGKDSYNVHVEWFLIPKKKLMDVYRIIDEVCRRQ